MFLQTSLSEVLKLEIEVSCRTRVFSVITMWLSSFWATKSILLDSVMPHTVIETTIAIIGNQNRTSSRSINLVWASLIVIVSCLGVICVNPPSWVVIIYKRSFNCLVVIIRLQKWKIHTVFSIL